ncbi:MAG: hypothetical protein HKO66_01655 [Saprospiraceae bacterium]|nr:hypothetical protein [Bacteroidia bacterium]NNL90915.1 hypothetical protein [Saprospiraceae bacterium]
MRLLQFLTFCCFFIFTISCSKDSEQINKSELTELNPRNSSALPDNGSVTIGNESFSWQLMNSYPQGQYTIKEINLITNNVINPLVFAYDGTENFIVYESNINTDFSIEDIINDSEIQASVLEFLLCVADQMAGWVGYCQDSPDCNEAYLSMPLVQAGIALYSINDCLDAL